MAKQSSSFVKWLLLAAILLVLDQFTKTLIVGFFQYGESHTVTSFFNVTRHHNPGAAFSFLAWASGWQRWFFIGLGVAATVFITWLLRSHSHQRLFAFSMACLLGGAVGNVIDRVLYGHVIDFVQLHYAGWAFPAFNVADAAITAGAIGMVLDEVLRIRRQAR